MRDLEFPVSKAEQAKPWSCPLGRPDCQRDDPCQSCQGRTNRQSGLRAQHKTKRRLEKTFGQTATKYTTQATNEENWRFAARIEVKSGKQCDSAWNFYRKAATQAPHVIGDTRPVIIALATDDDLLYIIRADDFNALYSER